MSLIDSAGTPLSGATPSALDAYERAVSDSRSWRTGAEEQIDAALQNAPQFVMAHVLQAWLLVCSRDPRRVQSARTVLARASRMPSNERERGHLAALDAVLGEDLERGVAWLGELLRNHPRDVLALQVAHVFDYYLGDAGRLADRAAVVLPAWSPDMPGYHAVLSMHAFGLAENGDYARAEEAALAALGLNPLDARAHHVMAHVFEMSERPDDGIRWMSAHAAAWSVDTVVATHAWWHCALFHLAQGRVNDALALYDQRIRSRPSRAVADLIDAAALLWRIELARGDAAERWTELATAWIPHIDDAYCSFTDIHAMLAFVGARDWKSARRLESSLMAGQPRATRHAATTRLLGLPACRALMAYGRGNDAVAIRLLAGIPPHAERLGGSHAQRDVLHLTLQRAVDRMRRPRAPRKLVDQVRALFPKRGASGGVALVRNGRAGPLPNPT
ncbi:MAG: tetratricopeptide repeat protein [Casimicrobiaceae bacterium]